MLGFACAQPNLQFLVIEENRSNPPHPLTQQTVQLQQLASPLDPQNVIKLN